MLIYKGKIMKKYIPIIIIILMLGTAAYWFVPIKFSFKNSFKSDNINKITIYRHGYFESKYDTEKLEITSPEKIEDIINYINNIYCTKKFKSVQYPLPKNNYEYVLIFTYKNNMIWISINNSVIQVLGKDKNKNFYIISKANTMDYFDNILEKK